MEHLTFIKAMLNKNMYTKYISLVNKVVMSTELENILKVIDSIYSNNSSVEYINSQELYDFFFQVNPLIKNKDVYVTIFSELDKLDVSESIIQELASVLIERDAATEIATLCVSAMDKDSRGTLDKIKEVSVKYEQLLKKQEQDKSIFLDTELDELLESECSSDGLHWRLNCLNSDIGFLRGGSLGHIFARVDTGKTTFLSSESTYFLSQLKDDEIGVWFNNEEKGNKVKLRWFSSLLGMPLGDIIRNKEFALAEYDNLGGNKLKMFDSGIISMYDIRKVLDQFNVRFMVIDQGDKVSIPGNFAKNTDRLTALYGTYRELAKTYPKLDIITVGQASAEADGQKWLRQTWMNESKTGKPGELDYAIGIGKTYGDDEESDIYRYIHVCKNKMNKGEHGKHIVVIDTTCARYYDNQD